MRIASNRKNFEVEKDLLSLGRTRKKRSAFEYAHRNQQIYVSISNSKLINNLPAPNTAPYLTKSQMNK